MSFLDSAARRQRESLRRRFLPDQLRLLFIGESPPASGRFFYRADSGLYRAIRDAFHAVDCSILEADFLRTFQAAGCYLIDLCPEPVDHLSLKARRAACRAHENSLARTIARLQPEAVATVVRSIESNVAEATSRANWQGPVLSLPYPGRWARHREIFVHRLAKEIIARQIL